MKNVVGFYSTRQQAEQVKDDLIKSGVDRDDITVYDREGKHEASLWEDIKSAFGFADDDDRELYTEAARRGAVAVGVSFDRDDEPATIIQIMQRHNPINLATQADQWRKEGWTGRTLRPARRPRVAAGARTTTASAAATRPATPATAAATRSACSRGRRPSRWSRNSSRSASAPSQSGGVRVHTRVIEKPVQEQVNLREEHVHVERRPVDRPLTAADQPFQERVIEATGDGRAAGRRQAGAGRRGGQRPQGRQPADRDRPRHRPPDRRAGRADRHRPEATAPARDFATRFFSDNRYKGRSWDEVEPDARRSFEQSYPGKWTEFRDAIRSRYDRDTSKSRAKA